MSSCHSGPCLGDLTKAGAALSGVVLNSPPGCDYAEAEVWKAMGGGWCCLHGCYCEHGVSVEWHEFTCAKPRDWSRSFHPGSVEVCLNLSGHGRLAFGTNSVLLGPLSIGVYTSRNQKLAAWRLPGQQHQFLTVEYSPGFLERQLSGLEASLHPVLRVALSAECPDALPFAAAHPLSRDLRTMADTLRHPPFQGVASSIWYNSKALELMSHLFFAGDSATKSSEERRQRVSQSRVERAIAILSQRLADPPDLEELGRMVGCSQYYLSRTFSREMGMTIPQYLRQIRMERAADLIKSGKYNITEAALEVGYNSLSHFSHAFRETMGCCPGLYPLGLPRQAQ